MTSNNHVLVKKAKIEQNLDLEEVLSSQDQQSESTVKLPTAEVRQAAASAVPHSLGTTTKVDAVAKPDFDAVKEIRKMFKETNNLITGAAQDLHQDKTWGLAKTEEAHIM